MNTLTSFTTPTVLAFLVIVIGYLIGKIKICNISLDLSAILIVAVINGYFISVVAPEIADTIFEGNMNLFSKLGTALFVSAIGLITGASVAKGYNKKSFVCLFIGAAMVGIGIVSSKVISLLDSEIDRSLLLGILCGSLTSTPGLSTVCEVEGVVDQFAVLGYGCSYLFGVIGVVMFVQLMTRKTVDIPLCKVDGKKVRQKKSDIESLMLIGLSVIFGTAVGNITIPFLMISLGNSGGILCTAVLLGFITERSSKNLNKAQISNFRNFGLVLFFVGSGIPAGIRLAYEFEFKWFIYGIVLTMLPVLFGYLLSCFIFKNKVTDSMAIIAGGMTSTPAIGVLLGNSKLSPDLSAYSLAYAGALFTMVILM